MKSQNTATHAYVYGFGPHQNVCHVSDGTGCKILKNPNYGNEMEEL
jgi:hypothetical protein